MATPNKGDVITIDGRDYRVLNVKDRIVEVLTLYNASTGKVFNSTDNKATFNDGLEGEKYQDSEIDVWLNNSFKFTLSSSLQNAIIPKHISQDMWGRNYNTTPTKQFWYRQYDGEFIYDEFGSVDVGERYSYLLSVQDIINYLGLPNQGQITKKDIWNMFYNTDSEVNSILWLRSAFNTYSNTVWYVNGSNGNLLYNASYSSKNNVRCAFQIDWSLLHPEDYKVKTTFVFDTTMIQRIDVYDEAGELRFGTDVSGAMFDSVIKGTTYTIKPTFAEHYKYKSISTSSTVDTLLYVGSNEVQWEANDTQPSTITITAEKIKTVTTFSWDKHITKIDIYDGQSLVYTQTEKNKSFTHVFDNKTYTIKPTILIGYMIDTVTASSANDTVVVNEDGSISWTAGWDNGDIFIYTKKDPSYYKKIPNGTYYWKDKLGSITESTYDEIIFNSNGRAFGGLTVTANTSWGLVEKISYGKNGYQMTVVAQRTSADQPLVWVDDKYKIITVDNVELTLPSYKWLYLRSNLRFSSEVEIQLYQCTCESNRVDKTEYLKLIDTISGTMRDSISMTDMSIEIEYPIPTFNYVYIPLFNRYYFVDDITAVVYGVWDVALSVDVLMTYKDTIKTLEAFVDRSQSNYNLKVIDNKLPLEKTETVEVDTVQNQLFVDNFGTYVLQGLQVSTGKAEGSN